ncbi:MAG TPA: SHOCT domain-containing protein [Euzebyales bacterium]|nr:SHOCT domain-containing protein [Euzebyales bacterium]
MCFRPRRPLLLLAAGAATPPTSRLTRRAQGQDAPPRPAVTPHTGTQAPDPSASTVAPPRVEMIDELERLARLRESGALTPEEFAAAKARAVGL